MTAASPRAERLYAYGDDVILVRAPRAATLAWLAEAVAPWFATSIAAAPAPAAIVDLEVDAERFRRLARAVRPTGAEAGCFTMDDGAAPLPIVRADDGSELALDARAGFALARGRDERGIASVRMIAARERPTARLVLLRVVRELASFRALARGEVPIHGAAVGDDDGVTLFVGGKRAGKSSLLVHALTSAGTRYVANDRVFARVGTPFAVVYGMPTIVTLRAGTLDLAPCLRDEIAARPWHYASTIAEARVDRDAGASALGRGTRWPPGLSPAQLCALLGVGAARGGALARIVFPEVVPGTAGGERFALRELSFDEASARVLAGGLVAGGRCATFLGGAAPGPAPVRAAVRALVRGVRCVHVALGRGAYAAPTVWDAIRDRAPAAPAARPAHVDA